MPQNACPIFKEFKLTILKWTTLLGHIKIQICVLVVDFPVVGYVPPEVLTELHFVLNHCAVELSPPSAAPAKATINPNSTTHWGVYIM